MISKPSYNLCRLKRHKLLEANHQQISIYPAVAQITWTWEDEEGIVQDYEHFSIPFILTVDKVLGKIRNSTLYNGNGGSFIPGTIEFTHNIGRCGRSLQVILQIKL